MPSSRLPASVATFQNSNCSMVQRFRHRFGSDQTRRPGDLMAERQKCVFFPPTSLRSPFLGSFGVVPNCLSDSGDYLTSVDRQLNSMRFFRACNVTPRRTGSSFLLRWTEFPSRSAWLRKSFSCPACLPGRLSPLSLSRLSRLSPLAFLPPIIVIAADAAAVVLISIICPPDHVRSQLARSPSRSLTPAS